MPTQAHITTVINRDLLPYDAMSTRLRTHLLSHIVDPTMATYTFSDSEVELQRVSSMNAPVGSHDSLQFPLVLIQSRVGY